MPTWLLPAIAVAAIPAWLGRAFVRDRQSATPLRQQPADRNTPRTDRIRRSRQRASHPSDPRCTAMPVDASSAAQADAHLALMDALGIDRAVVLASRQGRRRQCNSLCATPTAAKL
jgi:pimeloyl-ACP methyl ester carboxylesterase